MSVLALCFWNLSFQKKVKGKLAFVYFSLSFVNIYFVSRYLNISLFLCVLLTDSFSG